MDSRIRESGNAGLAIRTVEIIGAAFFSVALTAVMTNEMARLEQLAGMSGRVLHLTRLVNAE